MKSNCLFLFILLVLAGNTFSELNAQDCRRIDSLNRQLIVTRSNDTLQIQLYNQLAASYVNTSRYMAGKYAEKALKMAEKLNYQRGIADALVFIGLLDEQQINRLDKAIANTVRALNIYKELGNKEKVVELTEIIAMFYYRTPSDASLKNYRLSLGFYQEALKIRQEAMKTGLPYGDSLRTAEILEIVGELHTILGDDAAALKSLRQAGELQTALGNQKVYNRRLLAKYERLKLLEEKVSHSNTIRVIILFSIIIGILIALLIITYVKQRDAYNKLKAHNIDINEDKKPGKINISAN